jgi:hypothetical protein
MERKYASKEPEYSLRLKQTAYHEAGHVVMAITMRCSFRRVTIVSDENKGLLGHVLSGLRARLEYNRGEPSSRDRILVEKYILVSLAGNAAARIFTKKKFWTGANADLAQAYEYANLIAYGDEIPAYVEWLRLRAYNILVYEPCCWDSVEILANALLKYKTIGSMRARKIIKQGMDERYQLPE